MIETSRKRLETIRAVGLGRHVTVRFDNDKLYLTGRSLSSNLWPLLSEYACCVYVTDVTR